MLAPERNRIPLDVPVFGNANMPVVIEVVVKLAAFMDPFTSKLNPGELVLIPTLPPVVKMLPTVLLFPTAAKRVLARTTPADTFVSTRLVDVILTAVKVPATFKFPDKVMFAAVMSVVETPALRYAVPPTRTLAPTPTPPLTTSAADDIPVASFVLETETCEVPKEALPREALVAEMDEAFKVPVEALEENNEDVLIWDEALKAHTYACAFTALNPPATVKPLPTVSSDIIALADVSPDERLSVAEDMFVLLKVAMVAVVTLAFVIWAFAVVRALDRLNVAEVMFVETTFVI